jgi:hypothetical protein
VNPHYPLVSIRAGRRCEYCKAPEVLFNFPFEVEHISPSSRGGPSTDENLALSCPACNIFKSNNTTAIDPITGEEVRLFHPRRDLWEAHFAIEKDLSIRGNTAIGRATIQQLRINSPRQLSSRRKWNLTNHFP